MKANHIRITKIYLRHKNEANNMQINKSGTTVSYVIGLISGGIASILFFLFLFLLFLGGG